MISLAPATFRANSRPCWNQTPLTPFRVGSGVPLQNDKSPAVLLVEDEVLIRMGMAELLEDAGYFVREAGDGLEALASLNANDDVAVVITDIDLPRMDGLKLAEEAQRAFPHVRLILMSGKTYLRAELMPGEIPFFEKPVDERKLITCVRELIGSGQR